MSKKQDVALAKAEASGEAGPALPSSPSEDVERLSEPVPVPDGEETYEQPSSIEPNSESPVPYERTMPKELIAAQEELWLRERLMIVEDMLKEEQSGLWKTVSGMLNRKPSED